MITSFLLAFLPSTWTIIAAILMLWMYLWFKRPHNFPPGPRGVPILGVFPFLGKYPERTIQKWSKTYGPVFAVRFGPKDMVMLNDYESIYQVIPSEK